MEGGSYKLTRKTSVMCECGKWIVKKGTIYFNCPVCGSTTERSFEDITNLVECLVEDIPYVVQFICCGQTKDKEHTIVGIVHTNKEPPQLVVICSCGKDYYFKIPKKGGEK